MSFSLDLRPSHRNACCQESYGAARFAADGSISISLGSTNPLTPTVLAGTRLYLDVSVDNTPLTPQVGIAQRALRLGGFLLKGFGQNGAVIPPLTGSEIYVAVFSRQDPPPQTRIVQSPHAAAIEGGHRRARLALKRLRELREIRDHAIHAPAPR